MPFARRAVVQLEDRRLEDLRVTFDVTRNLRNVPSQATVSVYNLAPDTRKAIVAETLVGRTVTPVRVLLLAGYRDEAPHNVFTGRLRFVKISRQGADVITEIASSDGAPKNARVSKSFAPGADIFGALKAITTDVPGLGAGNRDKVAAPLRGRTVGAGGLALSGALDTAIETLLAETGIEWSVQDGQLQLTEAGRAVQTRAVELSPETSLVGSPELLERGLIKVRSLISPGLTPGLLVRVESTLVSGFYRVESARYLGDTEGVDWYIDLELKPVRA